MRPVCDTVANWLISHRAILAILAILLAAASVERSSHLEFARSIDTMFDRSDPALGPYRRLARGFGSSEVVLAAYDAPDLFTPAGIQHLRQLTDRLEATPGWPRRRALPARLSATGSSNSTTARPPAGSSL